jgi:NAD(P)-dependent dehydrogenase (short-subunit alcohol dehydrogenase family)
MTNDQPRVAWVTGASRGIGRGAAVAPGSAGWTVWVSYWCQTLQRVGRLAVPGDRQLLPPTPIVAE